MLYPELIRILIQADYVLQTICARHAYTHDMRRAEDTVMLIVKTATVAIKVTLTNK